MIGLMQIGAVMGQLTYNQLKREQQMNKQYTFCFEIEDLSTEGLHDFLNKASENHLFEDLPDTAREFTIGNFEITEPAFFTNGDVLFEEVLQFPYIGITSSGHVATFSKPSTFGKDTVFIKYPHSTLLETHLKRAAPNKQEQKTTEVPKGDEIVQLFQTADGRSFRTLSEAEYHRDRACLIEKLADDTGCDYDDAERALNWLEANHPKLKKY